MSRSVLIFICGMLLFLSGCSAGGKGVQSSPERVMERYLEAFQEKDLQTMFQLSDDPADDEGEIAFLENFVRMIELESYRIEDVELISADEALVTIALQLSLMEQGKSHREQVRVVRREGRWFLQGGVLSERS